MRWAFGFFALCVVLAIVRAALVALAIATVLALLVYFASRPREMLQFVGVLAVTGLATARPVAFIVMLGIIGVAVVVMGWKRKAAAPRLLIDEEHL